MDEALFPRQAGAPVLAALADTRVVVINGARQAGKSTLARVILEHRPNAEFKTLDVEAVRLAAQADPAGFVRHSDLLVIDEVQRVPELILAIKSTVDIDSRPGQFLLTGSAQLFAMKSLPDLLPGRSETIELWPLSQGEIEGQPDGFIDAIFDSGVDIRIPASSLRRPDYIERALRGGYPEATNRIDSGRRARFFESYASDMINRDIAQLSEIERPADMRRLLNVASAQMATLLVPNKWSAMLNLPVTTVRRYVSLLELVYLTRQIPAWSTNLTTRAIATPKVIMVDSGLAGHLAGLTSRRATHPNAPVGQFMENFVLGELARQLSWAQEPVRLYHYRDRDGYEVDAILERASGEIVAIEVKTSETVRPEDFRGIERLARRLGNQLIAGIVFYTGGTPLSFGNRLRALPISSLWTVG